MSTVPARGGDDLLGQAVWPAEGSLSPGAARRELGVLLKQLRESADLRLGDAGAHLQRSAATMSRLEHGKLLPRLVEVSALLDFYGRASPIADDLRERALALAADARKAEWFSPFRDVLTGGLTSDHIQRYIEFETDAEEILSYEVEFIPGLLQTGGYARAVAEMFFPDSTEHERTRFVDFRLARQDRLARGANALRLRAAIRQTAVRRVLGSTSVMIEQLKRLAVDLDDGNPGVDIRIVPDDLALPQAMRGAFAVMRFVHGGGLVYVEGREGADYLQNDTAVARYRTDFEALWQAALSQQRSLKFVEEVAGTIS
jgi:hypothetical protein